MNTQARAQRGLTLIELMVALAIGMVLTLALFGVLAASEGRKRVTTGLNDLEQAGSIATYQLDQWVRSAGSGFAAVADYAYGCSLHAKGAAGQTLPLTAALPAPFADVDPDGDGHFALAPVLILPGATTPGASGQSSDVLVVMGGAAGLGGAPAMLSQAPTAASVPMKNTLGFGASDLLLVVDPNGSAAGLSPCLLTQATSSFVGGSATTLPLGGSFYAATVDDLDVADFSVDAMALPVGAPATNPPQFLLIGVGDHDTLFTYDLLQTAGADQALQARTQGVFQMHALYGVDSDGDGRLDSWASPASGDYATDKLQAGDAAASALFRRIKAVRVALILRLPQAEKTTVSAASLTLFPDLAGTGAGTSETTPDLSISRSLTEDEQRYRYRVVDTTLVLRNNVMLE